jgi:hypothetical protein
MSASLVNGVGSGNQLNFLDINLQKSNNFFSVKRNTESNTNINQ